jgi:hypothetical protein
MAQVSSPASLRYESPGLDSTRREIRILELLPGQRGDSIQCRLATASLSSGPHYEALSYCWGDPTAQKAIFCDGAVLHVTVNLYSALKRLRKTSISRMLWVDAICINQEDVQERNEQVPLMRDIYEGCINVLVWLGEHNALTKEGFKIVRRMTSKYSPKIMQSKSPKEFWDHEFNREHKLPWPTSHQWVCVYKIFQRDYFSRMWVIQEVVVSRSIEVICGKDIVPWYKLRNTVLFLFYSDITAIQPFNGVSGIGQMIQIREQSKGKEPLELSELLIACRRSLAKEPLDKIFALYGLTGDPAQGGINIPVDYGIDKYILYRKVAAAIIRKDRDLSFLKVSRTWEVPINDLPSWVPDWSQSSENSCVDFLRRQSQEQQFWSLGKTTYNPCFRMDDLLLGVKGLDIVEIITVGELLTGITMTSPFTFTWLAGSAQATKVFLSWARMALECSILNPLAVSYDKDKLEELWLTLNAGCEHDRYNIERQAFHNWLRCQRIARCLDSLQLYRIHWSIHSALYSFILFICLITGLVDYSPWPNYRSALGRRMCITADGDLVLAAPLTRVGDRIAIFRGGDFPHVVRAKASGSSKSNEWELIGEAYVHSLMQCKAFDPDMCRRMWIV